MKFFIFLNFFFKTKMWINLEFCYSERRMESWDEAGQGAEPHDSLNNNKMSKYFHKKAY